jgi:hypothetical protein
VTALELPVFQVAWLINQLDNPLFKKYFAVYLKVFKKHFAGT